MTDATPDAGGTGGKKGGRKRLIVIGLAVLLLGGGGAGLWFSGLLSSLLGKGGHGEHAEAPAGEGGKEGGHDAATQASRPGAPVFFDMPEIIANLNAAGRRTSFIKLKSKLQLAKPGDAVAVQAAMPRLLDLFQTYLRETRPEELRGSAGSHRLREELMARANLAAAPARIVDVLFVEMLIQ